MKKIMETEAGEAVMSLDGMTITTAHGSVVLSKDTMDMMMEEWRRYVEGESPFENFYNTAMIAARIQNQFSDRIEVTGVRRYEEAPYYYIELYDTKTKYSHRITKTREAVTVENDLWNSR